MQRNESGKTIRDGEGKEEREEMTKKLCNICEENPAAEPHPCPYKKEINDDETTLCNCCEECKRECIDDI